MMRRAAVFFFASLIADFVGIPTRLLPESRLQYEALAQTSSEQSESLSFDDALKLILSASTAVKQADEKTRGAEARVDSAKYLYAPTVAASASSSRTLGDEAMAPRASQNLGLQAGLNLYRFGADAAEKDQASASLSAASFAADATRLEVEEKIAEALIDVIAAERERQVAAGFVEIRQGSAKVTQRLYQKGVRPLQETEKVAIDAANEEARLADAELRLAQAQSVLVQWAGRKVVVAPEWPWQVRLSGQDVKDAPSGPKKEHVAKRALEESTKREEATLRLVKTKNLPTLDFNLGYDAFNQREPDYRGHDWKGELRLTVPIFDRFSTRADYEEQAQRVLIANEDIEQKARDLNAGYSQARLSLERSLIAAQARDATLATARRLYEQSLKSFRLGLLSANELSLDQARLYETELNAVRGWADVHRYYARVCYNLGERIVAGQARFPCWGN